MGLEMGKLIVTRCLTTSVSALPLRLKRQLTASGVSGNVDLKLFLCAENWERQESVE